MNSENDVKYFIALNQDTNIGSATILKLLKKFNSAEKIWKSNEKLFREYGVPEKITKVVLKMRQEIDPDKEMERVVKLGFKVLTINDQEYPRLLHEISDPPALLYVRGELPPYDELSLAVVGARDYTYYGRQVVEKLIPLLVEAGFTIVSGLALGIDGYAHRAALTAKGRTIAILPTGVDRTYPACHRALANEIVSSGGTIISEYPLGTPSLPSNFPVRNRIIAGLSLGTLVIEANIASGSFLTAKSALDYNREVFAIPGSIFWEKSRGTNNLIKLGAKIVTSVQDILDELNVECKTKEIIAKKILPTNQEETKILEILKSDTPLHIDKIALQCGWEISKANSTLMIMEMKGMVRNLGGNLFIASQ